MPSNNETILQTVADLQTQVAFMNKAIKEMYALWGPIFQWGLLQAECKFGNNVQEFVLRKLKSLGAIEDQLELANALNAELQAQLAAANARQAEIVAELTKERARLDWALSKTATFYEWQQSHYLAYDIAGHDGFECIATDNPRATIDKLIASEKTAEQSSVAAEAAGGSDATVKN